MVNENSCRRKMEDERNLEDSRAMVLPTVNHVGLVPTNTIVSGATEVDIGIYFQLLDGD
jgi:hypothetical protein